MPRVSGSDPPAQPRRSPEHPDAPVYSYDPHLGSPRDTYTRADVVHREARQPEVPARFVAYVDGETMINTMWGRRIVVWHAQPGTPCTILGYWSDGTVHLRWPAIGGTYRVDGRFPAWVAQQDPTAQMAGGGRILRANNPALGPADLPWRLIAAIAGVVLLAIILAVPPTRDALGALLSALLNPGH
jgi:hypothetical protein